MARFEIVDAHTVRDADGRDHDVLEAIAVLPWVKQLCPLMPHEYAHQSKADPLAYAVVESMLKAANPDTYRAYFRGYPTPNRYWDAPDGQRYWLTQDDDQPLLARQRRAPAPRQRGCQAHPGLGRPALGPERHRHLRARREGPLVADRGCPRGWLPALPSLPAHEASRWVTDQHAYLASRVAVAASWQRCGRST